MTTPNTESTAKTTAAKNLSIWTQVETTDVKATKKIDSTDLTSINHNYQIKRATALFGPCGYGWGYKVIKAEILDGAILVPDKPQLGFSKISSVHIEFWYKHEGEKCVLEHFGQTNFVSKKATGELSTEDDAHKKSLTDALSKSLSMLGFSADIYGEINGAPPATTDAGSADDQSVIYTEEEKAIFKKIEDCKTIAELGELWGKLPKAELTKYQVAKDAKKAVLS